MKDVFTHIFNSNSWRGEESRSGTGSSLDNTRKLLTLLEGLFSELNIKKILDIPCGDFNWMQHLPLKDDMEYLGVDIVEEVIKNNISSYKKSASNLDFRVGDINTDHFPYSDIIMVRDCLVHFKFNDIYQTLQNLKKQKYKYILLTSFINRPNNLDLTHVGEWRPLNLQISPFNFPKPLKILNEECHEGEDAYIDKSLCLWTKEQLDDIPHELSTLNYNSVNFNVDY
jgi:hypothetical protein